MSKILKVLIAVILITSVFSCSKDKDEKNVKEEEQEEQEEVKSYPEENPLDSFLIKTGFNEKFSKRLNTALRSESGLEFTPKVKGKINAITLKIPDQADSIRVTIWKSFDKSKLKTFYIYNIKSDVEVTEKITPIVLEQGVKYLVSFFSNDYYLRFREDEGVPQFPIGVGNLMIERVGVYSGNNYLFPEDNSDDAYQGDISFVFQQID